LLFGSSGPVEASYQLFEAGQSRPVTVTPDASRRLALNTPDDQLEIFDILGDGTLAHVASVPVGMRPVAVALRSNAEAWVVNHLSDSVSIVDLSGSPRVVRTLHVGDEPGDIVFAGTSNRWGFVTTAHRGQNGPNDGRNFEQEGIGRADVWVFDTTALGAGLGGDEAAVLTLFGVKPMGEPATTARVNGTLHRLEHSWPRWLRRFVGPPITGHIRLSGILVEPKGSEG
jgi:hypothetical protein